MYVFTRDGGSWSQEAYVKASFPGEGDRFGSSLATDGQRLVVGALSEDSDATGINGDPTNDNADQSGAAYVFARVGGEWTIEAFLKASNTGLTDQFGSSVALSGDTIAVGAPGEASAAAGVNGDETDNAAIGAGAVYVFAYANGSWSQEAYVKASNPDALDSFGTVALSLDTLAVGALGEDSGSIGLDGTQFDELAPGVRRGLFVHPNERPMGPRGLREAPRTRKPATSSESP